MAGGCKTDYHGDGIIHYNMGICKQRTSVDKGSSVETPQGPEPGWVQGSWCLSLPNEDALGADEMVQWVKVPAAKTDKLSLMDFCRLSSDFLKHTVTWVHLLIKINVHFLKTTISRWGSTTNLLRRWTSKPHGSSCLYLPNARMVGGLSGCQAFYLGSWDSNYMPSTLSHLPRPLSSCFFRHPWYLRWLVFISHWLLRLTLVAKIQPRCLAIFGCGSLENFVAWVSQEAFRFCTFVSFQAFPKPVSCAGECLMWCCHHTQEFQVKGVATCSQIYQSKRGLGTVCPRGHFGVPVFCWRKEGIHAHREAGSLEKVNFHQT